MLSMMHLFLKFLSQINSCIFEKTRFTNVSFEKCEINYSTFNECFFTNSSLRNDIVNIPLHIFLKIFEMFCIGINPHSATLHGDLFQYARRAYAICDRAA